MEPEWHESKRATRRDLGGNGSMRYLYNISSLITCFRDSSSATREREEAEEAVLA